LPGRHDDPMDFRDAVIFFDATISFLCLWVADGKDARTFEKSCGGGAFSTFFFQV
jgi:hypothetical protein